MATFAENFKRTYEATNFGKNDVTELKIQAERACEYMANFPGCMQYEFKDGSKLQICHTSNEVAAYPSE